MKQQRWHMGMFRNWSFWFCLWLLTDKRSNKSLDYSYHLGNWGLFNLQIMPIVQRRETVEHNRGSSIESKLTDYQWPWNRRCGLTPEILPGNLFESEIKLFWLIKSIEIHRWTSHFWICIGNIIHVSYKYSKLKL